MDEEFRTKMLIQSLILRHRGKGMAVTVKNIATALAIQEDGGITNPITRKMITEIIETSRLPIGSCSNGYFLITTEDELNDYVKNLNSRIAGIRQRIMNVQRAFLDFDEAGEDQRKLF